MLASIGTLKMSTNIYQHFKIKIPLLSLFQKIQQGKKFKGKTWITWWRNRTHGGPVALWWDVMSTRIWGVTADQYRDVLGDRLSPVMKHLLFRLIEYEHDESYLRIHQNTTDHLLEIWDWTVRQQSSKHQMREHPEICWIDGEARRRCSWHACDDSC